MRALVISDTHFGAWTGRDLLREQFFLERLAPRLEVIDELIFLGDLFDFLFGSVGDAVDASDGLLRLIAEKLPGKRLVFLAGNHDHHLVHRDDEDRLETRLATGHRPTVPTGPGFFREFLERRLPGVEIEPYAGKLIVIEAGRRLSLQKHLHKDESILVISGRLRLTYGDLGGPLTTTDLGPGEHRRIEVGKVHRFAAIERCELIEVSTPELDDVIRIEDDFGREGTSAP